MNKRGGGPAGFGGPRPEPRPLFWGTCRDPLVRGGEQLLDATPRVELVGLLHATEFSIRLTPSSDRHEWSLGVVEQVILQVLIEDRKIRDVFEIGTFNGGTTRMMAERLPGDGTVTTLDLP